MQGRVIAPGVLDLSVSSFASVSQHNRTDFQVSVFTQNMSEDQTLIAAGINPPGHPKALPQIGDVLWKMARSLEGMVSHKVATHRIAAQSC
jgi:hypothetical protein